MVQPASLAYPITALIKEEDIRRQYLTYVVRELKCVMTNLLSGRQPVWLGTSRSSGHIFISPGSDYLPQLFAGEILWNTLWATLLDTHGV